MIEFKYNGGPAFPVLHTIDGNWVKTPLPEYAGMTLRDYFAAKAMQALIAKGMEDPRHRNAAGVPVIAGFAYEYADAMLEARGKT